MNSPRPRKHDMASTPPLVQVEGLTHRYPGAGVDALRAVDFRVAEGEVHGLLGPNGAGKSTLLAILTGTLRPDRGQVRVDGLDPRHGRRLRGISAIVPQEYAFYPALSGRENLAFFGGVYGLPRRLYRERLAWCTDICQLGEVLERPARVYSGGLKRRLNLAIALLNRPRILYLDEPTVGIDAHSRQTILGAIRTLREQGTTMIYTSHYMEEVEAICDSLTVINAGQVIASGTLEQMLGRLGITRLYLELSGTADKQAQQALATWQAQWQAPDKVVLEAADSSDIVRILQALAQHGLSARRLRYGISRLEAVYMQLLEDTEAS